MILRAAGSWITAAARMIQHVDDLLRRAGRRDQAVPGGGVEARMAELVDRGNTRQERAAPDGRDRERAQPAGPDVVRHQGGRRKHHLHMAADDVLQRRPRLLVGDMDEICLGLDLEQLAGEMGGAAVAGRREGHEAGLRLGELDQLLPARCAGRAGCTTRTLACVPSSVIGAKSNCGSKPMLLLARGVGGQNAGVAHEQRVAVGRGLRGLFGGDDAAGAGAVLDHQRLTQNREPACCSAPGRSRRSGRPGRARR